LISQADRSEGASQADLPFERPIKFDLKIDLRIARMLKLEPSPAVLARADEVIE
jgi:putative tryptophan/tyrosine transport system substrate-binding protein